VSVEVRSSSSVINLLLVNAPKTIIFWAFYTVFLAVLVAFSSIFDESRQKTGQKRPENNGFWRPGWSMRQKPIGIRQKANMNGLRTTVSKAKQAVSHGVPPI